MAVEMVLVKVLTKMMIPMVVDVIAMASIPPLPEGSSFGIINPAGDGHLSVSVKGFGSRKQKNSI